MRVLAINANLLDVHHYLYASRSTFICEPIDTIQNNPDGWITMRAQCEDEDHACFVVLGLGPLRTYSSLQKTARTSARRYRSDDRAPAILCINSRIVPYYQFVRFDLEF